MKNFSLLVIFCVLLSGVAYCQSLEAYPTSQRYLFNPYNNGNIQIDSLNFCHYIYGVDYSYDDICVESMTELCNEYQMYPVSTYSPVQVYGVAIPISFEIMPYPDGQKQLGYYWAEDNLSPHDDSIRNFYWQLFVDSLHVQRSVVVYQGGCEWNVSGDRRIFEMYIYIARKNDDPQHPIILDSVKINYGINATGWNRFQRPKVYDCPPPNDITYQGGYILSTLEVFFDHPYTLNDTFFVGNTMFVHQSNSNWHYHRIPPVHSSYLYDPSGVYGYKSFNGLFISDSGEFIPRQMCEYYDDDPRWWRRASCPGAIDNSYANHLWGGPMAIVAPPPCMVANDVRMTQVGHDSATVEWNIPVGVSHCLLEYGPQGFAPGTGTVVDSVTEGRYCIHGLDEDTPYEVRVVCWCIYAEEYSDKQTVTFRTKFACPAVPEIHAIEVTDTTIALSWRIPDSADYTDVEYGPRGFAEGEGTLRPHITRGYYGYGSTTIGGLMPHTAYEVRLRNYCSNSGEVSSWYAIDTVTTGIDTSAAVIGTVLSERVVLRPNPATSKVVVESPSPITRIEVADLQGRKLYDAPAMSSAAEIATASWPRGTVVVTVYTTQGTVTKKLTLK